MQRFSALFTSLFLYFSLLPLANVNGQAIRNAIQAGNQSLLSELPARNIGPVLKGGRIVDLEVAPNGKTWYIAYASGGLFVTHNQGQSFTPIFDHEGSLGIGDIALSPSDPNLIWVGTGENNSSRSSYAGTGIYRSRDAGKTWQHCGLAATQHIGRIVLHPENPEIAWVAAIGPLYTDSPDRGVYKTTDGGQSWTKTLFVNQQSGAIDLVIHPENPDELWAATWERSRKAWNFDGDGPGSGIYQSRDGGLTWTKSMQGIPEGEFTGRIGLAIAPSQPEVMYAFLDNQETDPKLQKEDTVAGITARGLGKMRKASFLKLSDEDLGAFLLKKSYPKKYSAQQVKSDIESDLYTVQDLASYFGDANQALFNTGVKGAEVYRSADSGQTRQRSHEESLQGVSYTYGYYFGQVRVAPEDANRVFITGVPLLTSTDGGQNWSRLDTFRIHVDHHALWIDPADADHLLLGNDGGLYQSFDAGVHWTHLNSLSVSQLYTLQVDMATPYNVYAGLQDNGVLKGSSRSVPNRGPVWKSIWGGDGMFIVTDPKEKDLVYTGFQFGNYFRIKGNDSKYITPKHAIGQSKYRYNWRSPLVQSPHNHEILYLGNQYLMRSMDRGDHWTRLSPDLSHNRQPQANVPYSTLSSISESPLKFGLIWTGSDDGQINLTTDGGNTWKRVDQTLPQGLWVSKIVASPHHEQTAFACLTGYRNDDFQSYVYRTTDLGQSWQSLKGDLPDESVNILFQDPVSADLLYLGTDQGSYISLNEGLNWQYLSQLPNVAVYDMLVHPRENELVIGTHGRGVYIVDVKPLQALAKAESGQVLTVQAPAAVHGASRKAKFSWQHKKEPALALSFFIDSNEKTARQVKLRIENESGKVVYREEIAAHGGFNRWTWNLKTGGENPVYLEAGTYTLKVKLNFEEQSVALVID